MRLSNQGKPTRYRSWIPAEQDADLILGLRDRLLQSDDLRLGLLQQDLRLQLIRDCRVSTFELYGVELHHIFVRQHRLFRNLKLAVKSSELEIGIRNIRDHSDANCFFSEFCRKQIRPRGLGSPAILPPEIEYPGCLNRSGS